MSQGYYEEERTVYMIEPRFLLQDLTRALRKLGFEPSLAEEGGSWLLQAASAGRAISIRLESTEEVVEGLEVLGEIPVSKIVVEASGPEDFLRALRYRLEVELLRCLG